MPDTRELLEQARERLAEQDKLLRELTTMPFELASVVDVLEESVAISPLGTSKVVEVLKPKKFNKTHVGMTVRVNPAGQIAEASPFESYGGQATVSKVHGAQIHLEVPGGTVTVLRSKVEVQVGDLVILDPSNQVILNKLPKETALVYKGDTGVCWDDIGGHEDAKREFREALEMPYTHSETFKLFNKKPTRGFLLFGAPGNGKTLLAKAAASCLASVHGAAARQSAFVYVKGPEILSKWVGEAEATIRTLFAHAKEHTKANGFPAVLFIDEADAILGRRGERTTSGMEHTIVPQFLSEMDGMGESGAIVILATNRADILDAAVIRPGRIDRKIHVGAPNEKDSIQVIEVHLRHIPLEPKEVAGRLATQTSTVLHRKPFPLYKLQTKGNGVLEFGMKDLISGAMLAGLVERAVSKAIHRNIEAKTKNLLGLGWPDMDAAIQSVYHEHGLMTHDQELEAFQELRGVEITGVQKTFVTAS